MTDNARLFFFFFYRVFVLRDGCTMRDVKCGKK
jgi:hypothetical protein